MNLDLEGKVALITGGASGLGAETARVLAREGARIFLADRNAAALEGVVEEIRGLGVDAHGEALDVCDYEACERIAEAAHTALGGIDVLVASAGVGFDEFFLHTKPEQWTPMLEVNLRGVLNINHVVGKRMAEQRRGAIVNIASEAGKVGEKRMTVYAASKGGVMSFSKAFAAEMGRYGVRVNSVCPGVTNTPMTAGYTDEQRERAARLYPMGRLGEPVDTAAMIAFLASDQASWVTGQAISVNGGFGRS